VRKNNGLIFETSYRHKDGNTFPVEVSARLLQYAEDESIVAFVRDITERKQAEQERENLITELEAKNNELTQFTYTVSHDLKSPLVTINGYLGYIEQDAQSGNMERLQNDTRRIREATNKMHTLLTELLELSRIGRLMNTPESVPFDEIVREAVDVVHGQLDSRGVTVQTQPNLPIVHGDRQRLIEVLQNLLDNAAKYMGSQKNPLIVIGQQEEENGNPIYFVKDNGIGIAPEYHERIFGLFNKLDATTEGTGIGLALVKRIIEVHGGRIWVESERGQGSTFYFTLNDNASS
jgi:signal transduction histidine kinase